MFALKSAEPHWYLLPLAGGVFPRCGTFIKYQGRQPIRLFYSRRPEFNEITLNQGERGVQTDGSL